MIRNAVIHLLGEQPVVADLLAMPTPADAGLIGTNVRTLDGRRPTFIDQTDSTFFFPYHNVRFVEMPPEAGRPRVSAETPAAEVPAAVPAPSAADEGELEIDEDLLRRVREA